MGGCLGTPGSARMGSDISAAFRQVVKVESRPLPPPVANVIKLLQACINKSVNTGLFLTSLGATGIVKFMLLMLES